MCCYSHTIQARDLRGFFRRVNWCGILDRRQVWFRLIVGRSLNWPENREVRRCRSRRFLAEPILRATCNWPGGGRGLWGREPHLRHGGVLGAAPPYLSRIWIYIGDSTHTKSPHQARRVPLRESWSERIFAHAVGGGATRFTVVSPPVQIFGAAYSPLVNSTRRLPSRSHTPKISQSGFVMGGVRVPEGGGGVR